MELRQVHHFLALARTLNFTRAAEHCNISQPAFSQSIKRLEDEIGGALVLRRGRGLRLSELGDQLLHHFETLALAETKLKTAARRRTKSDRMELRVRVDSAACFGVAVAALEIFAAEFEDFDLVLETCDAAGDRDGETAGGVCLHITETPFENGAAAQSKRIGQEEFVMITRADHPLAQRPCVPLENVLAENVIAWRGCPLEPALRAAAASRGIDFAPKMHVDDFFVARALVAAGLGVTTAPLKLAGGEAVGSFTLSDLCLFTPIIVSGRTTGSNDASRTALQAFLERLPDGGMWRPPSAAA